MSDKKRNQAKSGDRTKVSISLPSDLLADARAAAARDLRTISGYFRALVVRDLGAQAAQKEARP